MTDKKFCIELKNLTKRFENTVAVDDVSFNVEENEFLQFWVHQDVENQLS